MSRSETLLPIVESSKKPPSKKAFFDWKNRLAVAVRIGMLLCIMLAIRSRQTLRNEVSTGRHELTVDEAKLLLPSAVRIAPISADRQEVYGQNGTELGVLTTTVPEANGVVGYRGPSHCLLQTDDAGIIQKVALLSSRDTPEHIQIVQNDVPFWQQFEGLEPGEALTDVDAVSGATLTSLAIAEGVALRMGQRPGSLKFPDSISTKEILSAWPELETGWTSDDFGSHVDVIAADGKQVGTLIRTGALADSVVGYQGPTELLIAIGNDGTIFNIVKRSTWDNEPYASYLDDEPWFWDAFLESSMEAVATADLDQLGIEGVSGATMTSMAAADTVVAAAKEWVRRRHQQDLATDDRNIRWTSNDIGSVIVVLLGCLIASTRLRSKRWLGILWNVVLLAYFGLVTGNLVSLVLIFGWSASGIAYQLAPGLAFVVGCSLMLPAVSKRNVYCSHLCPHGAAQQLLKNRLPKRFRLPQKWMARLTWMPGILLLVATLLVLVDSGFNLAAIEPFHAYIWYVSGVSSLALAGASLVWSSFEPMAWCRYGCATGRLLNYVRRSAASTRMGLADVIVLGLVVASWTT